MTTEHAAEPSAFYQGKTVAVCGGAGFVGGHLVDLLLTAGANVMVLDNCSRGSYRPEPQDGFIFTYGDVGNEGFCRDSFKTLLGPVDIVFNLTATVAGVIHNQSHHYEMFTENLRVLSTPLKIAAEYGVERFLQVSSVCVYSPDHNHPAIESNDHIGLPTAANAGYSYAKRMGELLAQWTASELGLHTVIVRPSNVVGPRDYFDDRAHVIPALIRKCLTDDTIIVYGTGNERREFIYVTDVARGMMAAVEHGKSGEAYNLGTDGLTCVTIRKLIKMIQRATDALYKPVEFSQDYDPGDSARWSDASKANSDLGWRYEVPIWHAIRRTVEWYAGSLE